MSYYLNEDAINFIKLKIQRYKRDQYFLNHVYNILEKNYPPSLKKKNTNILHLDYLNIDAYNQILGLISQKERPLPYLSFD